MNTVAYGLLGLLSRAPQSGYDLMLRLKTFWPVSHSQIYPTLARLEEAGLISCTIHPQSGKPDRKVYSLTQAGVLAVEEWMAAPTAQPAIRDELSLKAYCVGGLVSPERAKELFLQRATECEERITLYETKLHAMKQQIGEGLDRNSPKFGGFILLTKEIARYRQELSWCHWVLRLLDLPPGADLFDHPMHP